MEGKDLTENVIRNIVSEVLRECKNRHIRATSEFISYYIHLLQLDPNRGLTHELLKHREKIQTFVKFVVERLGSKDDPKILTLRLQHEFRIYIKELDETVREFRRQLNLTLYPLLLDIVEQDNRNTGNQLYHKISYYVTLSSGLGNPDHRPVFKEVLQVLKSILDPEEIKVFPSLQNYIKQELVGCLVDITTGIRLYNKACKKGGEGMADLSGLMERTIEVVRTKLSECREVAWHRAQLLMHCVEKHMVIIKRRSADWGIRLNFKSPKEKRNWEFRRDLATAHRQLSKTSRILLDSITELDRHRKVLDEEFNDTVKTLNKMVVPTLYQCVTDVFPHFTQLASIWKEFQDDAIRLREIYNIFRLQARQIFILKFDTSLEHQASYLQTWVESEDEKLVLHYANPNITVYAKTQDITKKELEFNGYCCWALTHSGGALIPAVIPLGVIEYKGRLYGFSSKMAANSFCKNPDSYILNTMDLARKVVHLIKFLDLEERLKQNIDVKVLTQKKEHPIIAVSCKEVQTDTHFQTSNITYGYDSNIWDYKRTVLKNRDAMSKRTIGNETDKTHQQESNHTQTYEMEDIGTQTMTETSGNTQKPVRFLYGLRGITEDRFCEMNLTKLLRFSQLSEVINKSKT